MRTRKYEAIEREFSSNLFPDYDAGYWYIYILTDAARSVLNCGICSNINRLLDLMDDSARLAPSITFMQGHGSLEPQTRLRLVYVEGIASYFQAEELLNRIISFTKLQKERLIRKNNPNWMDLGQRLQSQNPFGKNFGDPLKRTVMQVEDQLSYQLVDHTIDKRMDQLKQPVGQNTSDRSMRTSRTSNQFASFPLSNKRGRRGNTPANSAFMP